MINLINLINEAPPFFLWHALSVWKVLLALERGDVKKKPTHEMSLFHISVSKNLSISETRWRTASELGGGQHLWSIWVVGFGEFLSGGIWRIPIALCKSWNYKCFIVHEHFDEHFESLNLKILEYPTGQKSNYTMFKFEKFRNQMDSCKCHKDSIWHTIRNS